MIRVKSHRRGKSIIRAYQKVGKVMKRADKLLYGNRILSPGRQKQLIRMKTKLSQKKSQLEYAIEGKFRTGAAVLGGIGYPSTRRYFSTVDRSRVSRYSPY